MEQIRDPALIAIGVGHLIGKTCGDNIPVIRGSRPETSEDDLKGLGAVSASSGLVALFHAVGPTPEAETLEMAPGGRKPTMVIRLTADDLREQIRAISMVPEGTKLGGVNLGTPHFSINQFACLMPLLEQGAFKVPFYINTSRAAYEEIRERGWLSLMEAKGITVVTDTCTYTSTIIRDFSGAMMTNSGKWAYYAPGNLGAKVAFGSVADCVRSAVLGEVSRA
ncbi:MAG: aconitase X [Rhizobiaceae bacterium]